LIIWDNKSKGVCDLYHFVIHDAEKGNPGESQRRKAMGQKLKKQPGLPGRQLSLLFL